MPRRKILNWLIIILASLMSLYLSRAHSFLCYLGGKDYLVKLWDAKSGRELRSFHGHKNIVQCVKWNQNGNWVLTASKDQIIKLYDIRSMKELESFRGHNKDITALAWHPFHVEYFVSGSYDGGIFHWLVGPRRVLDEFEEEIDKYVVEKPEGYPVLCEPSCVWSCGVAVPNVSTELQQAPCALTRLLLRDSPLPPLVGDRTHANKSSRKLTYAHKLVYT